MKALSHQHCGAQCAIYDGDRALGFRGGNPNLEARTSVTANLSPP